mgnify:FL=1|tara:strand:+ start:98 stop:376 length:279 start_codon:yes stop_codon:yes gene_type:complete
MKQVIKKSIEELNELLPKEKKITMKNTTPLVGEKSKLESIDLVNLFVLVEKNLQNDKNYNLSVDEIIQNAEEFKTIESLEYFLNKKFKNEKK